MRGKTNINLIIGMLTIILSLFLGTGRCGAADVLLSVPETIQEHSNWCWDATCKSVLSYYGTSPSQCTIANWAWSRSDCCGVDTFYWSHTCNSGNYMTGSGSMQAVMSHWGVSTNHYYSSISWDTVVSDINAGKPFEMAWSWYGGGGHALSGRGYDAAGSGYLDYMDPWPGEGYTKSLYSWVVYAAYDHTWAETLRCTTSAPPHAQVTSLWGISGAEPGETVTLWAKVKNTGVSTLPSNANVWFWVTNYGYVGSRSVAGLTVGNELWYYLNWTIPSNAAEGTYGYYAMVYTNTMISDWLGPQNFSVSFQAQVTSLWGVYDAAPGKTVPLWARVQNTGSQALPSNANVWFWVTNYGYVGSRSVAGLAPGANNWFYINWTVPSGASVGTYGYYAMVYTTHQIAPWVGPQSFSIYLAKITRLWEVLYSPTPGETVTMYAEVNNMSRSSLPSGSNVWFYTDRYGYVGYKSVAGLAAGSTNWYSINWTIPSNAPVGNYTYWAVVYGSDWLSAWSSPHTFSVGGVAFNEQFNGTTAPNWVPVNGAWGLVNSAYYYCGLSGAWASSYYNGNYSQVDYQAKYWRGQRNTYSNTLFVRGTPTKGAASDWITGYYFQYSSEGLYSVFKLVNDVPTALQSWTTTTAINKGPAWNTLRVWMNGSSMYFWINSTLVWNGTDSSIGMGKVGVGFYGGSAGNLWVDYATLNILAIGGEGAVPLEKVSEEQQLLNGEANENPVGNVYSSK